MLGFYALDNRQKQSVVNVESLNVNELKVLQQILTPKE
jgi:intein-encoded DNA endonuclease-like protein